MSKTFERLLQKSGKTAADYKKNSKLGELHRRAGVKRTPEFERIFHLVRRDWEALLADGYAETLSAHLRAPGGTQTLRPAQVAFLTEACDFRGALGQLGVGDGKTLATALAPTLMGLQRPVLLAPAKLREKTARDFQAARAHWLVHPRIEFISFETLSRTSAEGLLESINPDGILVDEAHRLKNLKASCTRKVKRFMRHHPDTVFLPLSATFMKRSIEDVWHLLMWALKPRLMPLPVRHDELREWALAVDEKVDVEARVAPGALDDLPVEEEPPASAAPIVRARMAVQYRLRQTPGIIMTTATEVDASLSIELVKPPKSKAITDIVKGIRDSGEMLDGDILVPDPKDKWRYLRQVLCGFYYERDPRMQPWWLIPRRNWNAYTRHVLAHSNKMDSPDHVRRDVEAGRLKVPFPVQDINKPDDENAKVKQHPLEILRTWQAVREKFKPSKSVKWIDDSYMRWILETQIAKKDPTVIWVEHIAVGEKLAELSGLPFCHLKGLDKKGRFIEDIDGHVIASVFTCGEGVNLQYKWARNFIVSAPPNGVQYEQMFGRTFRQGQPADSVEFLILNAGEEQAASFDQAVRDAHFQYQTSGTMQRLLLADRV